MKSANAVESNDHVCLSLPIMSITRKDLSDILVERIGFTSRESRDFVDSMFEEMSLMLEENGELKLAGFGKFSLRDKVARPGRNPMTDEEVSISPRRVVTFHASALLKTACSSRK